MPGLRSNVCVDVTFESPVVFADDALSAIITFRNTDDDTTAEPGHKRDAKSADHRTNGQTQAPASQPDSDDWIGRRLSMQLANSFRDLYGSPPTNGAPGASLARSGSTMTRPSVTARRPSEANLLMGFVQLQGYYRLDESLVDAEAFEHVKTQGIVVGKHGLEYGSGNNSGLLRGLTKGINNFFTVGPLSDAQSANGTSGAGTSLSGLPASKKSADIPIFSTPQSLLFVDLNLNPGESKSFSYQVNLPRNLPPSCRGKAISIYYNLVVGAQRLGAAGAPGGPEPKIILVPFRVFPYVDDSGNQPQHVLTDPLVLRADTSVISTVKERRPSVKSFELLNEKRRDSVSHDPAYIKASHDDFSAYIRLLLDSKQPVDLESQTTPKKSTSDSGSTSPMLIRRHSSLAAFPGTSSLPDASRSYSAKDNIDFFVKYYQHTPQLIKAKHFKSTFDISLEGSTVASISLSRPVYRIGEDIVVLFDFSNAQLPCYHITATLETTERVAPRVALRSPEDTTVLTRRIFGHAASSCFAAVKIPLQFTVPSTAAPQFSTSDISLGWSIKVDFVTADPKPTHASHSVLKTSTSKDAPTHSSIAVATSSLPCHGFSCRIPVQVYPTNQDIGALLDHSPAVRRWVL